MENNKKVWVYDLEQFENLHTATFVNRDNRQEIRQFVIHVLRNDSLAYYEFLRTEVSGLIGFNNVNYDYPLLHYFMDLMSGYLLSGINPNPYSLNSSLFRESGNIINAEYSAVNEKDVRIPQLDLFRIHHFDNVAKATSLKAVEIAINFENVQDLPFDEEYYIDENSLDEVNQVLDYNLNDVQATFEFYLLSIGMIDMRKHLGKKYNINLLNANDPKIGQEIFGRSIAKKKGWSYKFLKDMRTYRNRIHLGDCILPYIDFRFEGFKKLLNELKETVIETTYKAFEKYVIYKGFRYDYGTGGIHGCIEPGIYNAENGYIILDIDVKSFYPNLAIKNRFYPQHLGPDFIDVYEEIFQARMQAQRDHDQSTNSGLKLALNGVYGKSNDKYSLFYDPKYTMQTTINGQLLLTMLAEWIVDNILSVTILQVNTDGITIKLKAEDEEKVYEICREWESLSKLILEYKHYKTMIIRDVNNYMAIDTDNQPKYKGCFEIIPMQNGAIAYNKDWSMRVVPKALDAYYRFGTPIDEFIRNHDNIYDFCIGFRANKDWHIDRIYIEDGKRMREKTQRTIRYYISNKGDSLVKVNNDTKSEIRLNAGWASTMFNKYEKLNTIEDYGINYSFYISEANKIKYAVESGQLKLFDL